MENEADDVRKKGYVLRRAILDYGMGIIIFGFGVFLLVGPKLGFSFSIGNDLRYMFAAFACYMRVRVYRGSRKNYFN